MAVRRARIALFAALTVVFAGCNGSQSPKTAQGIVTLQETAELQPLVNRYKAQAVMGFDIKGTTLALSVDAERWSELDEGSEAALKDSVLGAWTRAWARHHPHQHATLRMLVQNYYGQEITSQSARV